MRLAERTILVTGGTRGIGGELTRQLIAKRARILVVGQSAETLEEIAGRHHGVITPFCCDLSDPEAVGELISRVQRDHSELSILINNAGIQTEMDFASDDQAQMTAVAQREIAVNLNVAIALSIGLLPTLRRQSSAAIVNVTSALAIAPKQASPVYCATKAGLRSFTKALRYQLSETAPNILISEIIMALVDTDMTRGRGAGKISPGKAATEIITGLEDDRPEVWVSKAKLLKLVNRLSPQLAERILR